MKGRGRGKEGEGEEVCGGSLAEKSSHAKQLTDEPQRLCVGRGNEEGREVGVIGGSC